MSQVTASLVKELRDRTGLGMMECKRALNEAGADIDKAIEELRKSSGMKAAKKAGRTAADGIVLYKSEGGFGMLLDGTEDASRRLQSMLHWDVNNGIARRAWARNKGADFAIKQAMKAEPRLVVTLAHETDATLLHQAFTD